MGHRKPTKAGVCTVNKDDFIKAFEDVPKITVSSFTDAKNKFETINTILSDNNEDWDRRIAQLKQIRSIIIQSESLLNKYQLIGLILTLSHSLELSVRDLRSQILREAAITCSFILTKYGLDVHSIGEDILAAAMSQVAVSTKIMATSAATLTEFIVENCQTRQIFTILSSFSTSKDKTQRRQLAILLEIVISEWNEKLKRQILRQICELLKSAICDADSETRVCGRKTFAKLEEFHPEDADFVFQNVDISKQKMLRPDATSSCASVNSDRGGLLPIRSKLGPKGLANISAKFLAQRSASAIDTNFGDRIPRPLKSPGTKLIRPTSTKTIGRIDNSQSPARYLVRSSSNSRTRASSVTSQPESGIASPSSRKSPEMINGPFVSTLSSKEADRLLNVMNLAKHQLRKPYNDDDDEDELLLLPIRRSPKRKVSDEMMSDDITFALKACYSSSLNERKEGIRLLLPIVARNDLNKTEIKNIGNCLNRMLSDVSNTMVLEVYTIFIRSHHTNLKDWLRLALAKLFAKKGSDILPNTKKQINHTITTISECFDPNFQLNCVCEIMCDPIHLMVPKARVVLLEYLFDLFNEYIDTGESIDRPIIRKSMRKMLAWTTDQRVAAILTQYIENVFCAMFCVNPADFCDLLSDLETEEKHWIHQVLQKNGLEDGGTGVSSDNRDVLKKQKESSLSPSVILPEIRKRDGKSSLGSMNSTTNSILNKLEQQSKTRLMNSINLNSTVELSADSFEKAQNVQELLLKMGRNENIEEQSEAIQEMYSMICEGSFNIWDQCYAKLLLTLFEILSKSVSSENNKKMALRVLSKMCTAQASKLFESTEIAVCKVLDAAMESKDPTTQLAVEDCLRTLATHLPLVKIINIARVILNQEPLDDERASLVLKMLTRLFEEFQVDELHIYVRDITPGVVKAYDSKSSTVRKNVIYCLVSIVNKVGNKMVDPYLVNVPKAMTNLLQVYIDRSISSSLPRI